METISELKLRRDFLYKDAEALTDEMDKAKHTEIPALLSKYDAVIKEIKFIGTKIYNQIHK